MLKKQKKDGQSRTYTELQVRKENKCRENIWCALHCLLFYCFNLLFLFKMGFCIKIPLTENCLNNTRNLRSSLELHPSFLITRALPLIAVIQTYLILILFFLQYVPWNWVIIINIKIYIDYLYTLPTLICQSWINWFQFQQDLTDNQPVTLVFVSLSTCTVFGILPWCVSALISIVCLFLSRMYLSVLAFIISAC